METVIYALKVNLAFTVLFAGYWVVMRKETWFAARRAWLLVATVVAVALPWLPARIPAVSGIQVELPMVTIGDTATAHAWPDLFGIATLLYLVITTLLLIRLVVRCVLAYRAMRGPVHEASSFFGLVAIPPNLKADDAAVMQRHEAVHAQQWHTLDVLLFEMLAALWWIIPIWRPALRELRLVHELTADAAARDHHPEYDRLIVAQAMGTQVSTLVHRFGSSNLRSRITMLHSDRLPDQARPRLALALPMMVIALITVSWQALPADPSSDAPTMNTVEEEAQFPGGMPALTTYLGEHIKYPWYSRQQSYQGTVVIGFTVTADGRIEEAKVLRGVYPDMDAEALRVVRAMPTWTPARKGGQAAVSQLTLPIRFQLSSTDHFLNKKIGPGPDDC